MRLKNVEGNLPLAKSLAAAYNNRYHFVSQVLQEFQMPNAGVTDLSKKNWKDKKKRGEKLAQDKKTDKKKTAIYEAGRMLDNVEADQ